MLRAIATIAALTGIAIGATLHGLARLTDTQDDQEDT